MSKFAVLLFCIVMMTLPLTEGRKKRHWCKVQGDNDVYRFDGNFDRLRAWNPIPEYNPVVPYHTLADGTKRMIIVDNSLMTLEAKTDNNCRYWKRYQRAAYGECVEDRMRLPMECLESFELRVRGVVKYFPDANSEGYLHDLVLGGDLHKTRWRNRKYLDADSFARYEAADETAPHAMFCNDSTQTYETWTTAPEFSGDQDSSVQTEATTAGSYTTKTITKTFKEIDCRANTKDVNDYQLEEAQYFVGAIKRWRRVDIGIFKIMEPQMKTINNVGTAESAVEQVAEIHVWRHRVQVKFSTFGKNYRWEEGAKGVCYQNTDHLIKKWRKWKRDNRTDDFVGLQVDEEGEFVLDEEDEGAAGNETTEGRLLYENVAHATHDFLFCKGQSDQLKPYPAFSDDDIEEAFEECLYDVVTANSTEEIEEEFTYMIAEEKEKYDTGSQGSGLNRLVPKGKVLAYVAIGWGSLVTLVVVALIIQRIRLRRQKTAMEEALIHGSQTEMLGN